MSTRAEEQTRERDVAAAAARRRPESETAPADARESCPACSPSLAKDAAPDVTVVGGAAKVAVQVCRGCGHGVTVPPVELADTYEPETYAPWGAGGPLFRLAYRMVRAMNARWKLRQLRRHAPNAETLLDFGAGDGAFAAYVARRGLTVGAVEVSAFARSAAARRGVAAVGSLEELGPARFDVVTAWHVLEHLDDPRAALRGWHERLLPGDVLFVAVPNFASTDAAAYGEAWAPLDLPRHRHHFTPDSLSRVVAEAGFVVETLAALPFDGLFSVWESERRATGGFRVGRAIARLAQTLTRQWASPLKASSILLVARRPMGEGSTGSAAVPREELV